MFITSLSISLLLFCFSKKVTKKEPRKNYILFREGALIKLLHYCSFNYSSLKTNLKLLYKKYDLLFSIRLDYII